MKVERQTYSVDEAAKLLGLGRNQAYEGVHRGEIPSVRVGKRILVPRVALDRLLEKAGERDAEAAPPRPLNEVRP